MIIKAGTKIRCSQGHDCGEVTRDIDTDQNVVVPHPARGRPPFTMHISDSVAAPDGSTWTCAACGEVVARLNDGSAWQLHTQDGWIG